MRKLRNAFAICCILVSFFQETVHANPFSDIYLIVDYNGLSKTYMIDRFVNLFDEQLNEMIELPQNVKEKLKVYIDYLRANHYGKIMA